MLSCILNLDKINICVFATKVTYLVSTSVSGDAAFAVEFHREHKQEIEYRRR